MEKALVASQTLVSAHPMFIFRSFLVREKYAWESSDRKWGLKESGGKTETCQDYCSSLSSPPLLSHWLYLVSSRLRGYLEHQ